MTNQSLSEELLKRLENLPPAEPRSKLEPLRELILRWRQQGRSYRRIQQLLREKNARSMSPTKLCAALSKDARDRARLSRNRWPLHLQSAQRRLAMRPNRAGTSAPTTLALQQRPSKRSVPAFRPRKEPRRSNLFARSTSETLRAPVYMPRT